MSPLIFVIIIIVLAWAYDFFNGANDNANAIATTVSTRALSPFWAVLLSSILNILGAFVTTKVAATIGKGIIPPEAMNQNIIISCLVGAIIWTGLCTMKGIPISVTHSLIGGLMGAGIASGGIYILRWDIIANKILLAMILAPALGFIIGFLFNIGMFWLFRKTHPQKANKIFRRGQVLSASFMAFSHGTNDTQNAMGIITAALLVGGFIKEFCVPFWVILGSGLFMGLGTLVGGWKVIRTLGTKVFKLQPVHGFSAEMSSALVILTKSLAGAPISTTHVISTAVMGAGASQKLSAVRWGIVRKIVITWIITLPGAGVIAGISYWLLNLI